MVYRYTLPAQRSPYACQQREICLRSQTISNAIASSPGLKRASLYAHKSLNPKEASLDYKPRVEELDKENIKITTYPVSSTNIFDDNKDQYDPADPTTWGIKPLPPLPHGSYSRKALSITSSSDDDATMLRSPILPPYAEPQRTPTTSLSSSKIIFELMTSSQVIHSTALRLPSITTQTASLLECNLPYQTPM
ncbi:hypothetical protein CRV24_003188 [Beauveria bassiana]|nr:hypothetical protein CRV24_003188 [Beauveria bassiana]